MERSKMQEGTRVRLTDAVERFPYFSVEAGGTGTVTVDEDQLICVKMDDLIPGCEDWDNEIQFTPDDESEWADMPFEVV